MIPVKDQKEVKRIVDLVQKYLEPHQPKDKSYQLKVIREGVQQEDEWLYVVVEPSREDVRSYDYNARLVEAEQELQEKENVKVLLVPTLPD